MANSCPRGPCKSHLMSQPSWESLKGLLRAWRSGWIGPSFPHPLYRPAHPHSLPSSTEEGLCASPPHGLCSELPQPPSPHSWQYRHTFPALSRVSCPPLNPSPARPLVLRALRMPGLRPTLCSVPAPSTPFCMYLYVCLPLLVQFSGAGNWASFDFICPAFGTHIYLEKIWR